MYKLCIVVMSHVKQSIWMDVDLNASRNFITVKKEANDLQAY